jgi:hypothetical protein
VTLMREHEIRSALRDRLEAQFASEPGTLFIDELGIEEGAARVDLAVVNGELHAFEIKSPVDSLVRLPAQAAAYGRVFDRITLVVADRHEAAAVAVLPRWWGVVVCDRAEPSALTTRRLARRNSTIDPFAVAQLLWRDEALVALEQRELARGLRSKPRRELWRALADGVPLADLQAMVRDVLRARRTWRADP